MGPALRPSPTATTLQGPAPAASMTRRFRCSAESRTPPPPLDRSATLAIHCDAHVAHHAQPVLRLGTLRGAQNQSRAKPRKLSYRSTRRRCCRLKVKVGLGDRATRAFR